MRQVYRSWHARVVVSDSEHKQCCVTCSLAFKVSAGNVTRRAVNPEAAPANRVCPTGGDVRSVMGVTLLVDSGAVLPACTLWHALIVLADLTHTVCH